MDTSSRNRFADTMKGIAILFILTTHFPWETEERLKFLFPFWIDMAVPTLMILSGYLSAKSFSIKHINSLSDAYSPKEIIRKALRLVIPYSITYCIEIALFAIISPKSTLDYFLLYFAGGRGSGTYYFPVMMQFIFVFPVIYCLIQRKGKTGLIICAFVNAMFELLQKSYQMSDECYTLLIFRYILLIASGCYTALYPNQIKKRTNIVLSVSGFLFIILFKYTNYKTAIINYYWRGTSFLPCLYIIPVITTCLTTCQRHIPFLELVGKASFNIFLVQKLYYWGNEYFYKYIQNRTIQFFFGLAICLVLGIVFYYIESPITKKITKKLTEKL